MGRTCGACGFENAEDGRSCPLCGASATAGGARFVAVTLDGGGETLALRERPPAAGGRPHPARAGEIFAKRYRLEALLGRGGMGQVYRARDLQADAPRALKLLLPSDEDDAERTSRFRREIAVLSKIRHPAVLRIHAWGRRGAELYFVSELVEGTDLKAEIQKSGAWAADRAAGLCATVAEALAAAHAQGVVHRDVKPSNIMLAADGSVKLVDFGLARGVGIDMATLTRTGMIVGTPAYMSPEQFEAHGVDERTDVYSLGVVLFELLTGRLPFSGSTPIAVAMKHRTEPPPAPRAVKPEVPAWMDRIVLRCLEKDPARRYATAAELAAALRAPRDAQGPRSRRLPTGDAVIEDPGESTEWALVLATAAEKVGWSHGMALRFEDRHFRLGRIDAPEGPGRRWVYRFMPWPEAEVFRRLVDYAEDSAARARSADDKGSRLGRWLGRRE